MIESHVIDPQQRRVITSFVVAHFGSLWAWWG